MISPLCQLNGGCMGCCGHDFEKDKIVESVRVNTAEFNQATPVSKEEYLQFRDRFPSTMLRAGVCRNLIEEKGCFVCPLHPARHKEDLRVGHCEINYLCHTAKEFATWHKKKQEKFMQFIEKKGLNNVEYSMQMDKGTLLRDFEK
jgi:hypothetical protein